MSNRRSMMPAALALALCAAAVHAGAEERPRQPRFDDLGKAAVICAEHRDGESTRPRRYLGEWNEPCQEIDRRQDSQNLDYVRSVTRQKP